MCDSKLNNIYVDCLIYICIGFLFILLLFFIRTMFLILPFIRTYKIYSQCTNDKKKIALKIRRCAALCSSDIHSKTKYGQVSCMALVSITFEFITPDTGLAESKDRVKIRLQMCSENIGVCSRIGSVFHLQ